MVQYAEVLLPQEIANQIIVLGAGVEYDAEQGRSRLHVASVERADKAADHYHANLHRFTARGAVIVCSGGFEGKIGQEDLPVEHSEGYLMRQRLIDRWQLPADLVKAETSSGTSLTNLANSLGLTPGSTEYIDPNEIGPENPLGLVSHKNHLRRARFLAHKLGIDLESVRDIDVPYSNDVFHELLSLPIYKAILNSANTTEEVLRREREIIRPLLGLAAPGVKLARQVKGLV